MIPFPFISKRYLKFTNELNQYIDEFMFSNGNSLDYTSEEDKLLLLLVHIQNKNFCHKICDSQKFHLGHNKFLSISGFLGGATIEADFYIDKTNFHCHINTLEIQLAIEPENLSYTYIFTPRGINIHLLAYNTVEQFKFVLDVYEPNKCKIKITESHDALKNPHFEVNKKFIESMSILLKKEEDIVYSILFNKKMKIKQEYLDNIELIYDIKIENNRQETTSIDLNQYVKGYKKTIKKSLLK